MSEARFSGRAAIVTGGTAGIGAATVRRLAAEGALQVVVGTPADASAKRDAVAAACGERGVFIGVDLAEEGAAGRCVRAALDAFGRLDVLVNNAGLDYSGVHVLETEPAFSRRVFDVNFFAALELLKAAAPEMGDPSTASIVNVASRAGVVGVRSMSVYGASKAALVSLTKSAALELAPAVRVNAVAPGMTEGLMMRAWIENQPDPAAFEAALLGTIPQRRMATPDEIAGAVLFLASDEARRITGVVLPVDGGYTAG